MQCNVKCFQNCEKECITEAKFHRFWLCMSFRRCDSMIAPFQSDKCRFLRIWPKLLNLLGPWLWMSIIYYAAQLGEPEQFLVEFFKLTKSDLNYIEADMLEEPNILANILFLVKMAKWDIPENKRFAQLSCLDEAKTLIYGALLIHVCFTCFVPCVVICKQYHKILFF